MSSLAEACISQNTSEIKREIWKKSPFTQLQEKLQLKNLETHERSFLFKKPATTENQFMGSN